jgi:transposase-like protein
LLNVQAKNKKTMEHTLQDKGTQTDTKQRETDRNNFDWLRKQPTDIKIALMQNHLSLCQLLINELLEDEVTTKAGQRYKHERRPYKRWGTNPGSVRVGDHKVKVSVPRLRDIENNHCPSLETYERLKETDRPSDQLLKAVLCGLSTRDYEGVIDHLQEGFGLSKSAVSRRFVERTKEKLREFETRSLEHDRFVAIFIDGKYLAREQIIIALGVTERGDKIPLSFIQSHTENAP